MKETILLAPGVNGTELLRTLAKNGKNTLGMRVLNGVQLAQEGLIRAGIPVTEEFLTRREETSLYDSFFREIPYFASASFADAQQLAGAVYRVRSLSLEEEAAFERLVSEGEFREKNEALRKAYQRYISRLAQENRIDSIGLMQKALREAEPVEAEFLCLKEFPLSPLERAVFGKLSGGEGTETDLMTLLGKEAAPLKIENCTRAYGAVNEVEHILSEILSQGLPLDQCTVAVTDPAFYSELFYDYSVQHGLPMSFGTGLPIVLTNPGKLVKLFLDWEKTGYNGIDATTALWTSDCFRREDLTEKLPVKEEDPKGKRTRKLRELAKIAGSLRLGLNDEINRERIRRFEALLDPERDERKIELLPTLKVWAEALSEGMSGLIRRFSVLRTGPEGRLDRAALNVITETLDACARFAENGDPMEAVTLVLDRTVASENSREGELSVTGIGGAFAALRPNLFIAGLSAAVFPGKAKENYLLLDSDLELLEEGERWTSDQVLLNKKQELERLVDLACGLGCRVHLSYPYYDLTQLKELNPSSSVYDLYQRAEGEGFSLEDMKKKIRHAGYFDSPLSRNRSIGKAYVEGKEFIVEPVFAEEEFQTLDPMEEKGYSPTGDIEAFFECPRRFYLKRVLHVEEPEEDDPFEAIGALDFGNLAHSMMEELGRNDWSREQFRKRSAERFDAFLAGRPALNPQKAEQSRGMFLRVMDNAYNMEMESARPAKPLLSEETLEAVHPAGVRLKGRIDWLSENEDGTATVVDFKTGRTVYQEENDVMSCLQTMLYSYMVEASGIADVSGAEYRYLRLRRRVKCEYNDEAKKQLEELLTVFRQSLEKGDFPYPAEEDREEACKYCKLKFVCGVDDERKEAAGNE